MLALQIVAVLAILSGLGFFFCLIRAVDHFGPPIWGWLCLPFMVSFVTFGNWWAYLHESVRSCT